LTNFLFFVIIAPKVSEKNMKQQSQAEEIIKKLQTNNPIKYFQVLDESQNGMFFILHFLANAKSDVYANTLAKEMNISRARVAVLIQKLLKRNLIEKELSAVDNRIEILKITPYGKKKISEFRKNALNMTSKIIDKIGIDEFNHYIDISNEIRKIIND
jgi:DNA-binding MarR family transcriptional regulator